MCYPYALGGLRKTKSHLSEHHENFVINWERSHAKDLTSLTSLDVSNNGLTSLPPEIGLLTGLIKLFVDGNPLTSLPMEVEKLYKLKIFGASGNPLPNSG